MVLPLIPAALIATGVITGGTGLVAGGNGARKLRRAKKTIEEAAAAHEAERQRSEGAAQVTNSRLRQYGAYQQEALTATVVRMSEFIIRNQRQVNESVKLLLDGIEVEVSACGRPGRLTADPIAIVGTLATAGTAGAGIAATATAAVTTFGVASTGTAIGTRDC